MNALLEFVDRHPLFSGVVGTGAGVGASHAEALHHFAGVVGDVGTIFATGTAILTFGLMIHQVIKRLRDAAAARAFIEKRSDEEDDLPWGD